MKTTKTVEYDESIDDYVITFTDEELADLGWKPNDQLIWTDLGNGSFSLKKLTENTMKLEHWLKATGHRVTEGSEYLWTCFENPYELAIDNADYYSSVIYNRDTCEVYTVCVSDNDRNNHYIWFHPDHRSKYIDYAARREINAFEAFDDVEYHELTDELDMLEKIRAITHNEDYDTRVQISVNLDDDVINWLYQEAHRQDITVNQLVNNILLAEINRLQSK